MICWVVGEDGGRDPIRAAWIMTWVSVQVRRHWLVSLVPLPPLDALSVPCALAPDALDVPDAADGPRAMGRVRPHAPARTVPVQWSKIPLEISRPGRQTDGRVSKFRWRSGGSAMAHPDPALFVPC